MFVVHLAARAHILNETARDPIGEFRRTQRDFNEPFGNGRGRCQSQTPSFFVSSIGVNGVETSSRPFSEGDRPNPLDPYALSKFEAEQCLREIEGSSELEVTIIRPPLVYGPGVKGNFLRLLKLVDAGIPIPLGAVCNRRSLIGLHNMCDLLALCAFHPCSWGRDFRCGRRGRHFDAKAIAGRSR